MEQLLERLRVALVEVLSLGTWEKIRRDHERAELAWREDLEPGSGKPKYVQRVLHELSRTELLALAKRSLAIFDDRSLVQLQDVVWSLEADGERSLTAITRSAVAAIVDGQRLHPRQDAEEFVSQVAQRDPRRVDQFFYGSKDELLARDMGVLRIFANRPDSIRPASHLELLDAYGFQEWPDKRVALFLERLVHPEVRLGDDQRALVDALNDVLRADGWRLDEVDAVSGHPVFRVPHSFRIHDPGRVGGVCWRCDAVWG